ncbi:MAG: hypothetical protein HYS05_11760 [Acidobacteria bacterium]|nr:hypothetical protein [Acidobacteriota bacterium]
MARLRFRWLLAVSFLLILAARPPLAAKTARPSLAVQAASPSTAAQKAAVVPAAAAPAASAKTWLEDRATVEEFLRTAKIVKVDEVGMGVTKPKHAYFAPAGVVASASWKPIRPGRYNGYWESYKSEIAAYELDKLLGMDMVPPTVERRVDGELGAASVWVAPVRMFKIGESSHDIPNRANWDRQVRKMKVFDNLIHNPDRNAGNLLIDPAGNLILIDHSRAFESFRELVVKIDRVDRDLWTRIDALTPAEITTAVEKWLTQAEIRSVVERRDRMRAEIAKLVAAKGEAAVLIP